MTSTIAFSPPSKSKQLEKLPGNHHGAGASQPASPRRLRSVERVELQASARRRVVPAPLSW